MEEHLLVRIIDVGNVDLKPTFAQELSLQYQEGLGIVWVVLVLDLGVGG
jgi:hypothetical protein